MKCIFVLFLWVTLLPGCANPINRVTSDDYAQTCALAERNNRLEVAEEACYRALVNVDLGNLGDELKSQRLYNLGRIKRQLAKFAEAEQLFKSSLSIEEKLSPPLSPKVGRRLVELAVSLAGQGKWVEGAQYLERALPMAEQFSGPERAYLTQVINEFSGRLSKTEVERFAKAVEQLGVQPAR